MAKKQNTTGQAKRKTATGQVIQLADFRRAVDPVVAAYRAMQTDDDKIYEAARDGFEKSSPLTLEGIALLFCAYDEEVREMVEGEADPMTESGKALFLARAARIREALIRMSTRKAS